MRTDTACGFVTAVAVACVSIAGCTPASDDAPAEDAPAADAVATSSEKPDRPAASRAGREVVAESLPYAEVGSELIYGHFAIPADMIDPLPAVVMIHDWWGMTDRMRGLAERLAGEGYIVLATDLFNGNTATTRSGARSLEIAVVENPELATENLRQALDFISASSGAPSIALVGIGFGGRWALETAIEHPDLVDATVTFYGQVVTDEERLANLEVPVLGFFLESDRAVPVDTVERFQAVLRGLQKDFDIRVDPDGRRGFLDTAAETHDQRLADEAWQNMLAFLESRLGR